MDEYRSRPKGSFILKANWDQLYVLTGHWKKDLDFYKEDLRFLYKLINKYFIWLTEEENVSSVRKIAYNLQSLNEKCTDLLEKVKKHQVQIGSLVEDPDNEDTQVFRIEHQHLEEEIAAFVKLFRNNRKEVFTITEHVVDSENLIGFLDK